MVGGVGGSGEACFDIVGLSNCHERVDNGTRFPTSVCNQTTRYQPDIIVLFTCVPCLMPQDITDVDLEHMFTNLGMSLKNEMLITFPRNFVW